MGQAEESARDPVICSLVKLVTSGIPEDKALWPEGTREYHRVRSELSSTGPIALFRVIVPASLQPESLEILLCPPGHGWDVSKGRVICVLAWDVCRHQQEESSLHQL